MRHNRNLKPNRNLKHNRNWKPDRSLKPNRNHICGIDIHHIGILLGILLILILTMLTSGCTILSSVFSEDSFGEYGNGWGGENPSNGSGEQSFGAGKANVQADVVVAVTVESVFSQPDIQSDRLTQVLYNQKVDVLEKKGPWSKVLTEDGVVGWLPAKSLMESSRQAEGNLSLVITDKFKIIESRPGGTGATVMEVVTGTRLSGYSKRNGWYQLVLPGRGTGYISESGTIELGKNQNPPLTTPSDFSSTALKFQGTKFMVGGRSYMGMDDAGLIYLSARLNGILLPLSIERMKEYGSPVEKEDLLPGDLVFFDMDNKGLTAGIYLGEGRFIHGTVPSVAVFSLEDSFYEKRYAGACRIFKQSGKTK